MSYQLTNSAHTLIGSSAVLPSTGSLSLWMKPIHVNGWADGQQRGFFGIQLDANNGFTLQKFSDNKLYFGWKNPTDYRVIIQDTSGAYSYASLVWAHFLLTWSVGIPSLLYLNGSLLNPLTGGGIATPSLVSIPTTTSARTFGNLAGGGVNMNGKIAEYALWNSVRSGADAAALYNGGSGGGGVSPVAIATPVNYWRMRDQDTPTSGKTSDNMAAADHLTVTGALFDSGDNPLVDNPPSVTVWGWNQPVAQRMGRKVELIGY